MNRFLFQITDWFLGSIDRSDLDTVRRARLLVMFCLAIAVFGGFFSLYLPNNDVAPVALVAVWIGTVAVGINPFLLRFFGSVRLASGVIVVAVWAVMTVAPAAGAGMKDASLWWLALVPPLAGFLLGAGWAVFTGAAVAVWFWTLWALERQGLAGVRPGDDADTEFWIALCGSTMVVVLTWMIWTFERSRAAAASVLAQKLSELELQRHELARLTEIQAEARRRAEAEARTRSDFVDVMGERAHAQGAALDEASTAVAEMSASLRSIEANVAELQAASTVSARAADEVTASGEQMTGTAAAMQGSAAEVATSTDELAVSIQQVAGDVELVDTQARRTADEMEATGRTLEGVRERATRASEMSVKVIENAARGAEAVEKTIDGITDIASTTEVLSAVLTDLEQRASRISSILDVIDEVVAQTNLLALNASITASQAGDRGRGFQVVATEMKKLGRQTAASTQEIATVIDHLNEGSKEAMRAVRQGQRAVEATVGLSRQAAAALDHIERSSVESTQAVKDIAGGAAEQATRARQVSESMRKVSVTLGGASRAVAEQARSAESLAQTVDRMRRLSDELAAGSGAQAAGSQEMRDGLRRVNEMVRALMRAHAEQTAGSDQILRSVEEIHAQQLAQMDQIDKQRSDPLTLSSEEPAPRSSRSTR